MNEIVTLSIAIVFLVFGIPIGNFLAKITKEELKGRQGTFKWIIIASLLLGVVGLILKEDALMFSCFFIAIVTSRGLRK